MLNCPNLQKYSLALLAKNEFYWLLKAVLKKLSICFLLINFRAITKIKMRAEKLCSFVKGSKNEYKNYTHFYC